MRLKLPGRVWGGGSVKITFFLKNREKMTFSPAGILGNPYLGIGVEIKNLLFSVFRELPSVDSPKILAPYSI